MQKVLVSAGAVGAAALELNSNQATEVAEAAPHGVQQRRRSQAKKEEPAVLIQRSLAQRKVNVNRVLTGRNCAPWIVAFFIALALAIALGAAWLGIALSGDGGCPSLKDAFQKRCHCGDEFNPSTFIPTVKCELKTMGDYESFEEAACTSIEGDELRIDELVAATDKPIVFNSLVKIVDDNFDAQLGSNDDFSFKAPSISAPRLIFVAKEFTIGSETEDLDATSVTTLEFPCLQYAEKFELNYLLNLKFVDFGRLAKVDEMKLEDTGTHVGSTLAFNGLLSVEKLFLDDKGERKGAAPNGPVEFQFRHLKKISDELEVEFENTPSDKCLQNVVNARFPPVAHITVRKIKIRNSNEPDASGNLPAGTIPTGHVFFGEQESVWTKPGIERLGIKDKDGDDTDVSDNGGDFCSAP